MMARTALAAIAAFAATVSFAREIVGVEWTKTVCDESPRTLGWPSVARLKDGTLLAVFSGNRRAHICPDGVVQVVRSKDGGETWGPPVTIGDTPVDDRDAGICVLPDGEILVTWFSSIAYYTHPFFYKQFGRWDKRSLDELKKEVDYFCVRSRDGGKTWTKPERMASLQGSSPHGPVVLRDGSLLSLGRTPAWRDVAEKGFGGAETSIACEKSTDGGRTWRTLCEKFPVSESDAGKPNLFHEPHVAELPDGRLVAMVRFNGPDRCFRRSVSSDGGRTWTPLERTNLNAGSTAPHLLALPGGRLVCTFGIRYGDSGVGEYAAFSSNAGETWTKTDAFPIRMCEPGIWSGDMGYPATVALADGSLLTVFYQPEKKGAKSVLMAAKWRIREETEEEVVARMNLHAVGDTANRCYCIYFAPEATNVVRRVAYRCPEFGAFATRLPYFHMRYPAETKGPFEVQAVVETKDGTRIKKTVEVPWNPNPIGKPFPNDRILLGTVAYGPGLERFEMTTNSLGNLYVRWNAAPQLLPENAGEEWMKEAERQGICCMTIYAGTPPGMRKRIKEAWGARYLGNNIGERTGFLYGSRFEMKGPQDRNLTEAREWFMSQFLRGDRPPRTGGTGEDPRMFATSGAAFANYELPAGVDFVCNELYAVGCANLTYATSEARGAARKWGPEWWAGWLAHEWQTFGIPYQSDDKYLSLEAGIKALYVMGTSLMCLESGSTGTQAHPYTKDADRNGYKYGDEPPRRYRETLRKCHAFITAHPRAKGTPETKIALALGQNDGYMGQSRDDVAPWGQHTNRIAHIGEKVNPWSCSHPEFTWERAREVFFPNSGTVGLSGTPYGQVDVVGVDDQTRLADLSRYSLLAFGGWNTMTKRQASLIEKWVAAGGTCALCAPQCMMRDDRDFLGYGAKDLLLPCGLAAEGFATADGIEVLRLAKGAKVEVVRTTKPGGGMPLVVRKRFGKGALYIMLAKEFPGARRELGEVWKNLLAERAADVPRTVALERGEGDDELRFFTAAAYRDKVYLMNLDMHATRKVTAVVKGRKIAVALKPLEVKEIGL